MTGAEHDSGKRRLLIQGLCILAATLIPFLAVAGFWFVLDFTDTSQGVERERDIGIHHTITDREMVLKALKVGASQGAIYAVIGFVAGAIGVIGYNRSKKSP
jgi:hypothetical protein